MSGLLQAQTAAVEREEANERRIHTMITQFLRSVLSLLFACTQVDCVKCGAGLSFDEGKRIIVITESAEDKKKKADEAAAKKAAAAAKKKAKMAAK